MKELERGDERAELSNYEKLWGRTGAGEKNARRAIPPLAEGKEITGKKNGEKNWQTRDKAASCSKREACRRGAAGGNAIRAADGAGDLLGSLWKKRGEGAR